MKINLLLVVVLISSINLIDSHPTAQLVDTNFLFSHSFCVMKWNYEINAAKEVIAMTRRWNKVFHHVSRTKPAFTANQILGMRLIGQITDISDYLQMRSPTPLWNNKQWANNF